MARRTKISKEQCFTSPVLFTTPESIFYLKHAHNLCHSRQFLESIKNEKMLCLSFPQTFQISDFLLFSKPYWLMEMHSYYNLWIWISIPFDGLGRRSIIPHKIVQRPISKSKHRKKTFHDWRKNDPSLITLDD